MTRTSSELPESCLEQLGLKSAKLITARPRSRIFRGRTEAGEIALKQCILLEDGSPDIPAATLEFESLQSLESATREAGMARLVPKPIGFSRSHAVMAMSWEHGSTLSDLIMSFQIGPQRAGEYGEMAGKLLNQVHGLQWRAEQSGNFQGILQFLETELPEPATPNPFFDSCFHLLRILAPEADAIPVPASWALGDFKTDNILVRPEGPLLLDVQLLEIKPVVFNIAQFLVHLEMLRWDPRGTLHRKALADTSAGFLRGYASEIKHWQLPLAWLQTEMLLHRCIVIARSRSIRARLSLALAQHALAKSHQALARCCK